MLRVQQILPSLLVLIFSTTTLAFFDPHVNVDYGRFQGKYNATYNITYFRRIPFGASTAGANRFRAPQAPAPILDSIYDTDQDFPNCPQPPANGSEDCLYLGIYSRPWDTTAPTPPKRPVVLVFYGGGFIQGGASFTLPPPAYPILNESAANDFVVVYSNYRVNAFGFLPGRAVKEAEDADLNVGLLDQVAALRWVNRWIGRFGGDEGNVTIWGSSAGGGSVVAQVLAQAGSLQKEEGVASKLKRSLGEAEDGGPLEEQDSDAKLFHCALASSPYWPKTYRYDDAEAETLYTQLVTLSGCSTSNESLACLKAADLQLLRNASKAISDLNKNTTSSFNWAPVIDGELLTEPLSALAPSSSSLAGGVTAWAMYNTHEGESFVPASLSNETADADPDDPAFGEWLRGYLPRFDEAQLVAVAALYPLSVVDGGVAEQEGEKLDLDRLNSTRARAGRIYRDSVLTCPGLWMAQAAAAAATAEEENGEAKAFLGEYAIPPAKHSSDVVYWNRVNALQRADPFVYHGFAGAFGRFFMTGDPNLDPASPLPPPLDEKPYAAVPPLQSGMEWVIGSGAFDTRSLAPLSERCGFWRANAGDVPV